jgi:hypothetical protein
MKSKKEIPDVDDKLEEQWRQMEHQLASRVGMPAEAEATVLLALEVRQLRMMLADRLEQLIRLQSFQKEAKP